MRTTSTPLAHTLLVLLLVLSGLDQTLLSAALPTIVLGALAGGGVALLADKGTGAWIVPAILLAGVLGGKSGRLYKRLVYKDRLAQDVRVEQGSQYLSSIFLITVTAKEGGDLSRVRQIVDEELARLRKEPPTAKEMERVKNEHEASFVYDLQSVGGFSGRTEVLQTYYAFTGDPDYLSKDIARFRATTAESVRQAQLTWLSPGRVTLMVRPGPKSGLGDGVVPTGAGPSKGGK